MIRGITDFKNMKIYSPEENKPVLSSLEVLNEGINGYLPGKLYLWTGNTGHGKTSFLVQEIVAALLDGEKVFWYAGEQSRNECLTMLARVLLGPEYVKTFRHRTGYEENYVGGEDIQNIINWLDGRLYLRCLNDYDDNYINIFEVMQGAKKAGVRYFVIDNLMTITAQEKIQGKDEWEKQERFVLDLKEFTKKEGEEVVMHLVAHPRKPEIIGGRPAPVTDITQVLGTSKVPNLVDMGFSVNKLDEDEKEKYLEKMKKKGEEVEFAPDTILFVLKTRGIQCYQRFFAIRFDTISCRFYTKEEELYRDWSWLIQAKDRSIEDIKEWWKVDENDEDELVNF